MALQVSSPAFGEGQTIPARYTCDGQNVSPPLEWTGQPKDTGSIAIICDDPDAPSGTFTHWVLYNVAGDAHRLPEGSEDGTQGLNSFRQTGFGGPCPPSGDGAHRYVFRVYALDVDSLGGPGLSQQDIEGAMRGHILAKGQLLGKYQRVATAVTR
jgi:Raf kinase inhibitor-like YbhB/YbcL family protein